MESEKEKGFVKEISFGEAEELDSLETMYFKPETNIQYELTFSAWKLVRKQIPKYKEKETYEEKTILELKVETVNGKETDQEWGIISKKLRTAFSTYCVNGNILKKVFSYKQKGDGGDRSYHVSELRDKKSIEVEAFL